jgi:hypothetical protein
MLKHATYPQTHPFVDQSVFFQGQHAVKNQSVKLTLQLYNLEKLFLPEKRKCTLLLPAACVLPDSFSCSGLFAVGRDGGTHLKEKDNAMLFSNTTYQHCKKSAQVFQNRLVQIAIGIAIPSTASYHDKRLSSPPLKSITLHFKHN